MFYYTYAHIRPDTGAIFYIGKGHKKRAYNHRGRNKHWHSVVNLNDGRFEVKILNWFNNENDALESEIWQIAEFIQEGNLVNKTPGGDGVTGWSDDMRDHQREVGLRYFRENPERLSQMSIVATKQFEAPGAKEAARDRAKLQIEKSGLPKGMNSESKKEQWQDESWRLATIEAQNIGKRTEEARRIKREIAKNQWSNPLHRANTMFYWWWLSNVKSRFYWGA